MNQAGFLEQTKVSKIVLCGRMVRRPFRNALEVALEVFHFYC